MEHVMTKLGAETRTAAARVALEAMHTPKDPGSAGNPTPIGRPGSDCNVVLGPDHSPIA